MNETKATGTPLISGGYRVDARGWYRVGRVRVERKAGDNPADLLATIRLITAAPEMLEALKEQVATITPDMEETWKRWARPENYGVDVGGNLARLARTRAAIAKAEGNAKA